MTLVVVAVVAAMQSAGLTLPGVVAELQFVGAKFQSVAKVQHCAAFV